MNTENNIYFDEKAQRLHNKVDTVNTMLLTTFWISGYIGYSLRSIITSLADKAFLKLAHVFLPI